MEVRDDPSVEALELLLTGESASKCRFRALVLSRALLHQRGEPFLFDKSVVEPGTDLVE